MVELFSPIEKRECELNDSNPLNLSFGGGEEPIEGAQLNNNGKSKKKSLKSDRSHLKNEELKSFKAKKYIEYEEFPNFYLDNSEGNDQSQRIE